MPKDFTFANHGSATILTPITDSAKAWAEVMLPDDAMMWGDGYVIEPRYAGDILDGIAEEGFTVGAA